MRIDSETYEAALDPSHPYNPLLYVSPYGGLWFMSLRPYFVPLEDALVRKALAHGQDMEKIVSAIWGPTATHAKGLISSLVPCHNPESDYQPYDPDLARQQLSDSSFGSGPSLPLLKIDLHRPKMVEMGIAMKEYWKDNLGVDLDVLKRQSGMPRRQYAQFYRSAVGSRIPDPIHIVNRLTSRRAVESPVHPSYGPGGLPVLDALAEYARSLPMDHPDRCKAFQAVEAEYLGNVYMIPIREVDPVTWLVQPWLRGFESTFNRDFNTLTTAFVARH